MLGAEKVYEMKVFVATVDSSKGPMPIVFGFHSDSEEEWNYNLNLEDVLTRKVIRPYFIVEHGDGRVSLAPMMSRHANLREIQIGKSFIICCSTATRDMASLYFDEIANEADVDSTIPGMDEDYDA